MLLTSQEAKGRKRPSTLPLYGRRFILAPFTPQTCDTSSIPSDACQTLIRSSTRFPLGAYENSPTLTDLRWLGLKVRVSAVRFRPWPFGSADTSA